MKEITHQDADKFWDYIAANYPEIDDQIVNRVFVNGSIVSFQPARMSDEDYNTYNRILIKWMGDNGFIEPRRDEIYVFIPTGHVAMQIYTDSILKIISLPDNQCKIIYKDETEAAIEIIVNEDAEAIRKRAYILN
jgi:hypothetical protein